MSSEMTFTAEFHSGFQATLRVNLNGFYCDWTPDLPRTLAKADRDALIESYRTWRDECLEHFAKAHQLTVHAIHQDGVDCIVFRKSQ